MMPDVDCATPRRKQRALRAQWRLASISLRAEALRLAQACREMSERFLRRPAARVRTRSLCHRCAACVGGVRASGDRRQTRAAGARSFDWLPPGSTRFFGREDIVMGFGPPEGDPEVASALDERTRRGAMTSRCPAPHGVVRIADPPQRDPFLHQEMIEILYHTLWETVHVFFEHRELGHDVGAPAFLYPFLGQVKQDDSAIWSRKWRPPSG